MAITDNNRDLYLRRLQRSVAALEAGGTDGPAGPAGPPGPPGPEGSSGVASASAPLTYDPLVRTIAHGPHAVATQTTAGFESAADKQVVDYVTQRTKVITYDGSDRVDTVTDAGGSKTMTYDGSGKLIAITGDGVYKSKTFTYDGGGKLTDVTVL